MIWPTHSRSRLRRPQIADALRIGDPAPVLALPDTAGQIHDLPEPGTAPATVVIWTCNHCPYALAWHNRILDVARDYEAQGVVFHQVNSNDPVRYPADSPEAMRERFDAEGWPMPYLHDADQSVAHAFGARTTPDIFVFDAEMKLAYRGAADADHQAPDLRASWLRDALEAIVSGSAPPTAETKPVGCSIKWLS